MGRGLDPDDSEVLSDRAWTRVAWPTRGRLEAETRDGLLKLFRQETVLVLTKGLGRTAEKNRSSPTP